MGGVFSTDLPPIEIAIRTMTEEKLGELKGGSLQMELCYYFELRDSISCLI